MGERTFEDAPAVRQMVPLLVGLVGSSGSGKTKSALRLAEGMQKITGGEIFGIDTEAKRMLHYADSHRFRHVQFGAPFDAMSYLAAVEHCARKGAKIIIIDSASHLHEGPGGTLEMHEAECERLMKTWKTTRDKVQMSAWQKPKSELRRFLNTVLQMQVNTIWCFRAKEKLKINPGKAPQPMGFMPIAGDEMIYEMTLNCLLYPNSGGVPSWHPDEMGEKAIIKLPEQFRDLFAERRPLDENIGRKLAEWAAGSKPSIEPPLNHPAHPEQRAIAEQFDVGQLTAAYTDSETQAEFDKLEVARKALTIPEGDARDQLKAARAAAKARLAAPASV